MLRDKLLKFSATGDQGSIKFNRDWKRFPWWFVPSLHDVISSQLASSSSSEIESNAKEVEFQLNRILLQRRTGLKPFLQGEVLADRLKFKVFEFHIRRLLFRKGGKILRCVNFEKKKVYENLSHEIHKCYILDDIVYKS